LEGQVVDGTFQLSDYLGGSPDSAVFLTSISGEPPRLAAIKLIPEDTPHAQERLASWRFASTLFHPNLIQIFQAGQATVNGKKYLYAVMEYAEENLGQIVPQRTLTEEEVSMLLVPALNALEYLHANGLVHGHIKPSDIMAMGDRLKVSMDGVRKPGEAIDAVGASGGTNGSGASAGAGGRDAYDPPEATSSAAGDVWSLGVTLVEVLTQRKPQWDPRTQADPVVPDNLPGSLRDIARNCLRRDPKRRWTIAGIGMRLQAPLDNPLDGYAGGVQGAGVAAASGTTGAGAHGGGADATAGAAAGAAATQVAGTYAEVTLPERVDVGVRGEVAGANASAGASTVAKAAGAAAADSTGGAGAPSVSAGGVSAAARTAPMRDITQDLRMASGESVAGLRATLTESSAGASVDAEAEHSRRGYLALAIVVFLVVVGLLGFKLLHPTPKATGETTQTTASEAPGQIEGTQGAATPQSSAPAQNAATTQSGAPSQNQSDQNTTSQSANQSAANQSATSNQPPAANTNGAVSPVAQAQGGQQSGAAGSGVVHQVIPEASEKSLSTIYGAVRVGIKVTADGSGNVTDATINSEGPSTYFANISLAAAKQWKFAGSGEWELRFEFRNDGAKVVAEKSGG
jgi:hypothetical protein